MESSPEYDVQPDRDSHGIAGMGYIWEVFDGLTQGPIESGWAATEAQAHAAGRISRDGVARDMYGEHDNERS